MAGTWFYMQDGKRLGPVALDELKQRAANGTLRREDAVWTVGLNAWTPASQVSGVFVEASANGPEPSHTAPVPFAPIQAHAPLAMPAAPIAYFDGGLPPRAARTLRGYAPPTGDCGDWPLDDARLEQFAGALKIRKKVTGAGQLYRVLLFLGAIAVVFTSIGAMGMGLSRGGGAGPGMVMLIATAFIVGLCILYYFAYRATMRAQRWAPLTMLILFSAAVVLNLVSMATAVTRGRPEEMIAGLFGMILPVIFAFVSWVAFAAIPKWRAQPAWCQELIVKSGL